MKLGSGPKFPIKPYYTLLYNQLSSNPIRVLQDTCLTNKTSFFYPNPLYTY